MQDHEKTKEQLIEELLAARRRIAALERAETESHSDRQRVEAALEQERNLLHTLMDHLPDNIYFKDAASRFIRISKAMATQFGLGDPAEAVGKTDFDFFTDEHARQAMADEEEILRTGRAWSTRRKRRPGPTATPPGRLRPRCRCTTSRAARSAPSGCLATLPNGSARRKPCSGPRRRPRRPAAPRALSWPT